MVKKDKQTPAIDTQESRPEKLKGGIRSSLYGAIINNISKPRGVGGLADFTVCSAQLARPSVVDLTRMHRLAQ